MAEQKSIDARKAALLALHESARGKCFIDTALHAVLAEHEISSRDAALASQICFGVVQNRLYLDYRLQGFMSIKMKKAHPIVRDILRIGAYQILFLSKIPPSAAVTTAVDLSKQCRQESASGLINAVLRKLAAAAESPFEPVQAATLAERLSITYSTPLWLVARFLSIFGEADCEALLAAQNRQPPITILCNTTLTAPDALSAALIAEGVEVTPVPGVASAFFLAGTGNLTRLSAFAAGHFTVQDLASQMAVLAAGAVPGDTVIDLCAAPGGKSFYFTQIVGSSGQVLSFDVSAGKITEMKKSAERLSLFNIQMNAADAREENAALTARGNVVLCDVPCSGLGVIRKKPDIRYKDPAEVAALPSMQAEIIRRAAQYVAIGGVLLYSTCTLLPEENEDIVTAFLQENSAFSLEAFSLPWRNIQAESGMYTFTPHADLTDGFFVAKLRRKG